MTVATVVGAMLVIALAGDLNAQEASAAAGTKDRLSEGLIGHWTFDEGQGNRVPDSSGNGLEGTLVKGPQRIAGVLGSALQLNGTDQAVSIAHSSKLRPSRQITISAWVLPDGLRGARCIYRKEDGEQRHLFAFHDNGATLAFGLNLGGVYKELSAPLRLTQLSDDRWHLAAAVYDGAAKRVYWDGVEIGSEPASGTMAGEGWAPAYIGSFAGSFEFLSGCIDDVRIYSRA